MKLRKIYESILTNKQFTTDQILQKLKKIGYHNFELDQNKEPKIYTDSPGIAKVKIVKGMAVMVKIDQVFGLGNYDTKKSFLLLPWKQ